MAESTSITPNYYHFRPLLQITTPLCHRVIIPPKTKIGSVPDGDCPFMYGKSLAEIANQWKDNQE